jgi:multiple sugar transport system permease protein
MTRKEWTELGKGMAFLSPWLIGFLVLTLLPEILCVYYSLCDYSILKSGGGAVYRGGANYSELMHDEIFWKSLGNTFYYAAMSIPACLLVSLGLALLLNMKVRGQAIYRTIIFLPSLVPTVASAMLWLWIFNGKYGLINHLIDVLSGGRITGPEWLTDKAWAMPALAMMSVWGVGYAVVIYLAGLQDVPRELYEAAEIDGAGTWRRLWNVTLPMLSPVIFFNLVMALIGTLQYFEIPQIMTQGKPDRATEVLAMFVYNNAFINLRMGYACATACVLMLIILLLTGLVFLSSRSWVHYQGK